MCGKFTQMMSWRELRDLSELATTSRAGDTEDFVTPMRLAQVLRLDESGKREVVPMRWGFADLRAKTPLERPKHMHARAETLDSLPTFREAFAHARGLVIVKTFNIGEEIRPGKVIQHTVTPRDGKPLAFAVLWERWTDRSEGSLLTFVMVTTEANALLRTKTDRMPAVVEAKDWSKWLGEVEASPAELKALLMPYEGDWDMAEQRRQPAPAKPRQPSPQPDLF
jgi:putative SOS response-associated peptidase YedK